MSEQSGPPTRRGASSSYMHGNRRRSNADAWLGGASSGWSSVRLGRLIRVRRSPKSNPAGYAAPPRTTGSQQTGSTPPADGRGSAAITVVCPDLASTCARLETIGLQPMRSANSVALRDPDGNLVRFVLREDVADTATSPPLIVGLGVAGNEHATSVAPYAGVFRQAATAGLHIIPHAGEQWKEVEVCVEIDESLAKAGHNFFSMSSKGDKTMVNASITNIVDAVLDSGAHRIGHGSRFSGGRTSNLATPIVDRDSRSHK